MIQFFNNVTEQYKDKLRTPFFGTFIFWWFVFHVEAVYDLLFIQKLTKNIFVKAKSICVDNSICDTNFNELNNTQKELLLIDYKRLLFNSLFEFSLSNLLRIIFLTLLSLLLFYFFKALTFYLISYYNNVLRPFIVSKTRGRVVTELRFNELHSELEKIENENRSLKEINASNKKRLSELNENKKILSDNIDSNKIEIASLQSKLFDINEKSLTLNGLLFFSIINKYFGFEEDVLKNDFYLDNKKLRNIEKFIKSFKYVIPKYKQGSIDQSREYVLEFTKEDELMIKLFTPILRIENDEIIFRYKEEFEKIYYYVKEFKEENSNDLPF